MIILNGNLKFDSKVILDQGLFFGRGLFETILVKNKPVFLKEHLHRINDGLSFIGVKRYITQEEVIDAVEKLNCVDGVLKLVATEKNVIFTKRNNNYTEDMYESGFAVNISSVKRNQYSNMTYLKSLNYLENILEHDKCIEEGYNEVLFFNVEDKLSEGSVSNVYFIKDDKIFTPSLDCGLLNGTLRKFIMNNFEVLEGKFGREDLLNSDGVFLTNSIMGVMKVSQICDQKFGNNTLINDIRNHYKKYLHENY